MSEGERIEFEEVVRRFQDQFDFVIGAASSHARNCLARSGQAQVDVDAAARNWERIREVISQLLAEQRCGQTMTAGGAAAC